MTTSPPPVLRLAAEYGADPLWLVYDDGSDDTSAGDLGVSADLAAELEQWATDFAQTYDPAYPPDSRFHSDAEEEEFEARGLALARRLATEVGERFAGVEYAGLGPPVRVR